MMGTAPKKLMLILSQETASVKSTQWAEPAVNVAQDSSIYQQKTLTDARVRTDICTSHLLLVAFV